MLPRPRREEEWDISRSIRQSSPAKVSNQGLQLALVKNHLSPHLRAPTLQMRAELGTVLVTVIPVAWEAKSSSRPRYLDELQSIQSTFDAQSSLSMG